MKPTVFEEELIRTLEGRSRGGLQIAGDWITVNNKPEIRVLKLQMEGCALMPIVYPEEFETRHRRGETLERLADEILEQVRKTCESNDLPADFFRDFDKVKKGLFCRVISASKNQLLLQQVPHEICEDLAIVYYYEIDEGWMEDATILIRNEHLEMWEQSPCDIRGIAWENTLKNKKVKFRKLSQVLSEYGLPETEEMEENPLYLLTNEEGGFGAITAFYPKVLAFCAERLKSDLILLPSSIHEWLLLPAKTGRGTGDAEELRSMVREINRTQLEEKEILSDEIYYYSVDTERLNII